MDFSYLKPLWLADGQLLDNTDGLLVSTYYLALLQRHLPVPAYLCAHKLAGLMNCKYLQIICTLMVQMKIKGFFIGKLIYSWNTNKINGVVSLCRIFA